MALKTQVKKAESSEPSEPSELSGTELGDALATLEKASSSLLHRVQGDISRMLRLRDEFGIETRHRDENRTARQRY
jgi:hypothetical protein